MSASHNSDVSNSLLNAAEEVVLRDGVGRLTLDAVAREAGLSKSGLLHHYPSKESLINSLVQRTVELWSQSLEQALILQPPGPYRTAGGLLQCCLGNASAWNEQMRRSSTALLAVLVHCPRQKTALHQFYRQLHQRMETEGKGSPVGDLVLAVIDGIWLRWVTDLAPLDDAQIARVRNVLESLIPTIQKPKKKVARKRS